MRICITHRATYRYESPTRGIVQVLRLTPRDHDGQHVLRWRIEPKGEAHLRMREDSLGNVVHVLSSDAARQDLVIEVEGEVETNDTNGIVRMAVERAPPLFFLRDTELTRADASIKSFAAETAGDVGSRPLEALHRLLSALPQVMSLDDPPPPEIAVTAEAAFAAGKGAFPDFAHVFIAAARHLGIPARYVSGYLHRADGQNDQHSGHAWAEALVPDLGWVGFDAANELCPTDAHVRVAIGLDQLGAAPIRGSRYGGGSEHLSVEIRVDSAKRQAQN